MIDNIINTFLLMPGWAQFLIVWPLPSTISLLFLVVLIRTAEARTINCMNTEETKLVFWLSTVWPLLIFITAAMLITEINGLIIKYNPVKYSRILWKSFDRWTKLKQTQHQMRVRLKKQPVSKPLIVRTHFAAAGGTRCGVGNPNTVIKARNRDIVTCPTCKFLMRRDTNG